MKSKIKILATLLLVCFCSFLIVGCTSRPNKYNITVNVSHANLGSAEGGNNTYTEGDTIKIKATPATSSANNKNPEFVCWLLDNKAVTTQAEYEFEVSSETAGNYIALFSCEYLEYFSVSSIIVDTGIAEGSNASVTKLSLELGTVEGITKEIYSVEPTATENVVTLTSVEIYEPGENPYAYDMQEDIFVKFVITYEQDGVIFVSTTSTKIEGVNDVTLETIGIQNAPLNLAKNPENTDLTVSLPNTPTLSLNLSRLTTFEITNPEVEEE